MTNGKWREIMAAREMLGLKDKASLEEIRRAYRLLAKRYHPDVAEDIEETGAGMRELTAAFKALLNYGVNYPLPLVPTENGIPDDEEWWMKRFGCDPLWGKGEWKNRGNT
jgi:hypothetical protein